MIRANRCLYHKFLILVLIAIINSACTAGGFILQKKDLDAINERLTVVEHSLDFQSKKMDQLIKKYKKQHNLLTDTMEKNSQSFQLMENLITQNHDEINQKIAKIYHTAWLRPNGKFLVDETNPKSAKLYPSNTDWKRKSQFLSENVSTDKLLVGRIEKVRLIPPGRIFHARIDTGATTSSLDARDTESFERDGDEWVRFKIKDPKTDNLYEVEKPVIRRVKIIQASTSEADRRPVIELQLQIGRLKIIEEFTLEDRAHLDFQVLIGRNVLQDLMLVDVAEKFINPLPEENKN
jgi:uncharacterized coiled-coil protein SlyX